MGGAQAIAMFAYGAGPCRRSTWSPARATSTRSPPSGCSRGGRHRLRGRPHRDRGPGRRHRRPGARRRRPDQPGRARPAGRQRPGHPTPSGSPTRSRPSSTSRSRRPGTSSGSAPRWPAAVRDRAGRRPRPGPRGGQRVRRRAPRDPDRRRRGGGRAGAQRRRDLRRAARAGVARRLLRRLQPRAAHRRLRLPLLGPVGAGVPAAVHVVDYTREALARSPTTWSPSPRPRTCPATAPAVRVRFDRSPVTNVRRRCARSLRGLEPYGAPQLDVPVQLNVNENPYGPRPGGRGRHRGGGGRRRGTLNRYPDREFAELRAALAAYLRDTPHGVTPDQVWAANGSNEVMLAAAAGLRRARGTGALGFAPTYSMYPEYARDTMTGWVAGPPRDRLLPRPRPRPRS